LSFNHPNSLRAFRDRSWTYHLKNAYGLYWFAFKIDWICPLTYSMAEFESAIVRIESKRSIALYDAMNQAAHDLISDLSPRCPGASRAGARRRILVITDGEDSEWGENPGARTDPATLANI
jgi:hypothetical protein